MDVKEIFNKNLHPTDSLGMNSQVELMPEVALTSFTVCDACRYFVGQA